MCWTEIWHFRGYFHVPKQEFKDSEDKFKRKVEKSTGKALDNYKFNGIPTGFLKFNNGTLNLTTATGQPIIRSTAWHLGADFNQISQISLPAVRVLLFWCRPLCFQWFRSTCCLAALLGFSWHIFTYTHCRLPWIKYIALQFYSYAAN